MSPGSPNLGAAGGGGGGGAPEREVCVCPSHSPRRGVGWGDSNSSWLCWAASKVPERHPLSPSTGAAQCSVYPSQLALVTGTDPSPRRARDPLLLEMEWRFVRLPGGAHMHLSLQDPPLPAAHTQPPSPSPPGWKGTYWLTREHPPEHHGLKKPFPIWGVH